VSIGDDKGAHRVRIKWAIITHGVVYFFDVQYSSCTLFMFICNKSLVAFCVLREEFSKGWFLFLEWCLVGRCCDFILKMIKNLILNLKNIFNWFLNGYQYSKLKAKKNKLNFFMENFNSKFKKFHRKLSNSFYWEQSILNPFVAFSVFKQIVINLQ
jgi:hypothetical protein